jgi:hypothetical protein
MRPDFDTAASTGRLGTNVATSGVRQQWFWLIQKAGNSEGAPLKSDTVKGYA